MPGLLAFIRSLPATIGALPSTIFRAIRKKGTPVPVPPAEREKRAREALAGPRARYCLGAGGRNGKILGDYVPRDGEDKALTKARRALGPIWSDCSGAIAGVLGLHRAITDYANGWGYFSTDGVIADANDPAVELVEWAKLNEGARPWEFLVVYGSVDRDGDGKRDAIGHIGIVAAVPPGWVYTGPESLRALTIWHCAASQSETGAIRLSDGAPWAKSGRLLHVID